MKIKLLVIFLISSSLTSGLVILFSEINAQNNFYLRLPFDGNENSTIISYVDHDGIHHDVFTGTGEFMFMNSEVYTNRQPYFYDGHRALDFPLTLNTPVLVAANGRVEAMDEDPNGWGFYILVNHDNLYKTRYSHLYTFTFPITRSIYITDSGRIISVGSEVISGETIAYVDSTGNSYGNHLDFEVLHYGNNRVTDPFGWWGSTGDDPLAYNDQDSTCLWNNVWCNEFIIEDGDINISGHQRFQQWGTGWTQVPNVGRQSGMRYLSSGNGTSYGFYDPMFRPDQDGIYEVFAYIPAYNATAVVTYEIRTDYVTARTVITQADYSNEWVSLGQHHFGGEHFEYVKLSNQTNGGLIGFDELIS